MMRLAGLHSLRVFMFLTLSFLLIYQPVFTLPASRAMASAAGPKAPARAQVIKHKHKTDEVIIKFHQGAPQQQLDEVVNAFAKEKKELRGNKGVAKLKLRDGYDVSNTVYNLSQLNAVVQWVEPNYGILAAKVRDYVRDLCLVKIADNEEANMIENRQRLDRASECIV
ncbi:MAG: hypothetical protein AB7U82_35540, partial [Blastocatellales bacterium]